MSTLKSKEVIKEKGMTIEEVFLFDEEELV